MSRSPALAIAIFPSTHLCRCGPDADQDRPDWDAVSRPVRWARLHCL
jgi:hypothetical protein